MLFYTNKYKSRRYVQQKIKLSIYIFFYLFHFFVWEVEKTDLATQKTYSKPYREIRGENGRANANNANG